jgi:hypothetical protein
MGIKTKNNIFKKELGNYDAVYNSGTIEISYMRTKNYRLLP